MNKFVLKEYDESQKNKLDQVIPIWKDKAIIFGYLDLLSGDEAKSTNSFIQESSHIFIVFDVSTVIDNSMRILNPRTQQEFEITYVDNPLELNNHYEIYCKVVA